MNQIENKQTTPTANSTEDPFDKPFELTSEETLAFDTTYCASSGKSIFVEGIKYLLLKLPYMNFDDHIKATKT